MTTMPVEHPTPPAATLVPSMIDDMNANERLVLDILEDFTDVIDRGAPLRLHAADRDLLALQLEQQFDCVINPYDLKTISAVIAAVS
jgi:hypothetical protein